MADSPVPERQDSGNDKGIWSQVRAASALNLTVGASGAAVGFFMPGDMRVRIVFGLVTSVIIVAGGCVTTLIKERYRVKRAEIPYRTPEILAKDRERRTRAATRWFRRVSAAELAPLESEGELDMIGQLHEQATETEIPGGSDTRNGIAKHYPFNSHKRP